MRPSRNQEGERNNIERRKKGPKLGQNIFYHEADQRIKSCLFFALGTEEKKRYLQNFFL